MNWQIHELHFRLLSPLHIGWQKIGNIQRTRPYVPARVLWAAVTARLARDDLSGKGSQSAEVSAECYSKMGTQVKEQLAFSYLYPTSIDGQPLYPHHEADGLRFGSMNVTPEIFTWRYLGSYASTALDYTVNAAEEGTLHEVEFIAPHTRPDDTTASRPVILSGYVLVKDGCILPWQSALTEMQIGGERGYGWGRLQLTSDRTVEVDSGPATLFGYLACYANGDSRPRVQVLPGQPLLAHTAVDGVKASGDVEPLVGRIWDKHKGAGQHVEVVGVCYAPGARLQSDEPRWFEWTTAHIWKMVES